MNVGAAEVDITPDFEVELCGFAARTQPAVGVLEPIFARALYLDDGNERLLWIVCDVVALGRELVEGFRAWAKSTLGLESRQVLLCATHTHSAPATIPLNAAGQYSDRYVRFLRFHLEGVAREGMRRPRPCRFIRGRSGCSTGVDRRRKGSSHVDHNLWTLAFADAAEKTDDLVAVAMNYPMHPVALGSGERRISPDWCGAAAGKIYDCVPGRPVVLVTNGAAGNINPWQMDVAPERVRQMGEILGTSSVRALAGPRRPDLSDATLAIKSVTIPLPLDVLDDAGIDAAAEAFAARFAPGHPWAAKGEAVGATWRESMKRTIASPDGGGETPIEIQAIRIGDVRVVAVNGEVFSRFTELVRKGTTADLFVVGYANAAFGYIPTRAAYAEGGYEVDEAHFFYNSFRPKPGGLEMLADRAIEVVRSLDDQAVR